MRQIEVLFKSEDGDQKQGRHGNNYMAQMVTCAPRGTAAQERGKSSHVWLCGAHVFIFASFAILFTITDLH